MPVVHIFSPSMRQPDTPLRVSRTAFVSMCVASEPWLGSVRPKVTRSLKSSVPLMYFSLCAADPKSRSITMNGKLPTTECSFCRSLNRPSPLLAMCSRITAIHRLPISWPPNSLGNDNRQKPALSARFLHSTSSASHS